jgi:hypothetical protein
VSFIVTLALAIGLLVAVPIAAHFLRRGTMKEQAFPPARYVPSVQATSRRVGRLEDLPLLVVRALLLLALAVLGAGPLVRCSRLSLTREAGASIALAIVVDDSGSMRALVADGSARFEHAIRGTRELVSSAREGDAITIVLAGKPARVALAATSDLRAVRLALDELQQTDRGTDLDGALALARATLEPLPHVDKRIALLSDLAGETAKPDAVGVFAPLEVLRQPAPNCGIVSATAEAQRVVVEVACSAADAAKQRGIELVLDGQAPVASDEAEAARAIAAPALEARAGLQTLALPVPVGARPLSVALSGSDAIAHDDRAPVLAREPALVVGVLADQVGASAVTGGSTVVEQALRALEIEAKLRPLALVPEEAKDLAELDALVLDDPTGFRPEARAAITKWLEGGALALALLGPNVSRAQLGSSLEPFALPGARWVTGATKDVSPRSASAPLGSEAQSLVELRANGRVDFGGALGRNARVHALFEDGEAFWIERDVGRGLAFTVALPASPDVSDFALRSGFLALLEYVMSDARRRRAPSQVHAGATWTFPAEASVKVEGPSGSLSVRQPSADAAAARGKTVVPEVAGRYEVVVDGTRSERVARVQAEEVLALPGAPPKGVAGPEAGSSGAKRDVSSAAGLFVLVLFALELALRAYGRFGGRRLGRHLPG